MKLYGQRWTRRQLEARAGRLEQIGGIRKWAGCEGTETGMEFVQVRTGSGLTYWVTPTKGLDISLAEFAGTPFSWQSSNGDAHPAFYDATGTNWLKTASGGLLMTCGLTQVGSPCDYNGTHYGLHGRIHHTPAKQVSASGRWVADEYIMSVSGVVEETSIFGGCLRLYRTVQSRIGENTIEIEDVVENAGFRPAPHMMLYHFNFGFPLLTEQTRIEVPPGRVIPRDDGTDAGGYGSWNAPNPAIRESVYYHELSDDTGTPEVRIHQLFFPAAGRQTPVTLVLRWDRDTLPNLVQWKMPGAGEHVLGLEPSNCRVEGLATEQAGGTLRMLEPGETIRYRLAVTIEDA